MKLSLRAFGSVVLLVALLGGCGSEGVASLTGSLERPTLDVQRSLAGADVDGGFELVLFLGKYAESSTEVSLGAFSVERDGTEVYSPLSLASKTPFPVTVGIGEAKRIAFTFVASAGVAAGDALCAGPLAFRGSVSDTLSGNRPTTLVSGEVTPSCSGP